MREREPQGGGSLQAVTQLAGLLAAVVAVVYGTGGVVLSLRLALEHLPWSNVVSGLPRDFVVSIGAGQVLLPSLAVGGGYAIYRVLRGERAELPSAVRLGRGDRAALAGRCLLTLAVMLIPLGVILWTRETSAIEDIDPLLAVALFAVLALAAVATQEGRAILVGRARSKPGWNRPRAVASMAALYAAAAVPALTLSAAATPLTSVKVCIAGGGEERGRLVGESNDRVYLGEDPDTPEKVDNRRIVAVPNSNIEQMFVGPHPDGALCAQR